MVCYLNALARFFLYHSLDMNCICCQFVHWEKGCDVFGRLLIDSDWAINNGNWLWLSCLSFFYQVRRITYMKSCSSFFSKLLYAIFNIQANLVFSSSLLFHIRWFIVGAAAPTDPYIFKKYQRKKIIFSYFTSIKKKNFTF